MRDDLPRLLIFFEKVIDLWISNTPKFMQPNFVWLLYYRMLDRTCEKNY